MTQLYLSVAFHALLVVRHQAVILVRREIDAAFHVVIQDPFPAPGRARRTRAGPFEGLSRRGSGDAGTSIFGSPDRRAEG